MQTCLFALGGHVYSHLRSHLYSENACGHPEWLDLSDIDPEQSRTILNTPSNYDFTRRPPDCFGTTMAHKNRLSRRLSRKPNGNDCRQGVIAGYAYEIRECVMCTISQVMLHSMSQCNACTPIDQFITCLTMMYAKYDYRSIITRDKQVHEWAGRD